MDQIVRDQEKIDEVLNKAAQGEEHGTAYTGQTYEQGVSDMHRWLTGASDDEPLEDVQLLSEG